MDLGLAGKKAIVTAASRGLGRAVALRLAQEGVELAICARGLESLQQTAEDIHRAGGRVFSATADVSDDKGIKEFVASSVKRLGAIDILVNNAGGPKPGRFGDLSEADWGNAFNLTFMSVLRLCHEVVPHMRKRGGGRIINLSSLSIRQPLEGLISSNSIRLAVVGFAKTLADELAPENITVNTVCPGFSLTDRLKEYMASIGKREKQICRGGPEQFFCQDTDASLGRTRKYRGRGGFLSVGKSELFNRLMYPCRWGRQQGLLILD